MTKEEKELLLKDLCMRLPYDVNVLDDMGRTYKLQLGNSYLIDLFYENGDYVEAPIRPYLRPMESMTEEEINEFILISDTILWLGNKRSTCILSLEQMDWLNKKGFDYRGLIPMELALPAKEGMYNQ